MSKEEQFDFYWKEIFTGLAYNPIEFNTYRFDQSMSLPGKVNKLYEMFKQLALNNQEVMDYLKEFVETFDEKLYGTVTDVLEVWLTDGRLAEIMLEINELYGAHIEDFNLFKADMNTKNTEQDVSIVDNKNAIAFLDVKVINDITVLDTKVIKYPVKEWEKAIVVNSQFPYFNVQRYGIIDDGQTDNTLLLQNLINLAPDKSVLFFPVYIKNSHYVVSNTLTINHPLTLEGENKDSMIYFNIPNEVKNGFNITSDFVEIKNMRITTEINRGGKGIYYHNNTRDIAYSRFIDLTIDGFSEGIHLKNCFYIDIDNNLIRDSKTGVLVENCTTTLNIRKTYVLRCDSGYKLTTCLYGSLDTCACDHASLNAYALSDCGSFNVLNCGSEVVQKTHMVVSGCKGLNIDGYTVVNTKTGSDFASMLAIANYSNISVSGLREIDNDNANGYSVLVDQFSLLFIQSSSVKRKFEPSGYTVGSIETVDGHLIFDGMYKKFFGLKPDKKPIYKIGDRYINRTVSHTKPIGEWICVDNTSGNTEWRVFSSTVFDHQEVSELPPLTPFVDHGVYATVKELQTYQFVSGGWKLAFSLS